ncbi:MAG: T9SS type A sorting domain-containing protein [bacterium]|nr:T9SS type A sorting domain-containing protein [candidate division KSB1 bacterium]MDH7561344.1 T9SS type A sorting domain-containing protein [bacterium]
MRSLIVTMLLPAALAVEAVAQHRIPWGTLSNGGGVSSGTTYCAKVVLGQPGIAQGGGTAYTIRNGFLFILAELTPATGVPAAEGQVPAEFGLGPNFPNPFNPSTTIPFSLKTRCFVTLRLFDGLGREVATLVQGNLEPGRHTVILDGSALPSGVYFYRIEAGPFVALRKATLLK